jgi:hypothetical protein
MFNLFRAFIDRVKALFAISAAQELESEFLARDAERRAELLRQAERYDAEGLHGIAQHLRQQAETHTVQQPLASVLPAIAHLQASAPEIGKLTGPVHEDLPGLEASRPMSKLTGPKKKGEKS